MHQTVSSHGGQRTADAVEEMYEAGRGDGFMFVNTTLLGSAEDLVDLLVPELQRRGRFRLDYGEHQLRSRLAPS